MRDYWILVRKDVFDALVDELEGAVATKMTERHPDVTAALLQAAKRMQANQNAVDW